MAAPLFDFLVLVEVRASVNGDENGGWRPLLPSLRLRQRTRPERNAACRLEQFGDVDVFGPDRFRCGGRNAE
jgi:hypothetical protein